MTRKQIVQKFLDKPSYLQNGSGLLSKMWDCTKADIVESKAEAREMIRGGDIPEGFVLNAVWGSATNPMKSYKKVEEDVDKLREFKDELIASLEGISPNVKYTPSKPKKSLNLLEIDIPDYHFGKITGQSVEEQSQTFLNAVLDIYEKANTNDEIDTILFPIGNDLLNSEHTLTTTKGTKQENNATFMHIFKTAWTTVALTIAALSERAPVEVIIVPGNHDENATIMLGEVIRAFFMKNERVTVDNREDSNKYYKYGKNLFLFNHGDKGSVKDLPLRMAVEKPVWFSKCPYRFVRLGHFHKASQDETMGIEISVLPSLSAADKWHKDHNYLSKPKITATMFNNIYGKAAVYNIYLEHI